jgi:ABC-2 type transport system permease protein
MHRLFVHQVLRSKTVIIALVLLLAIGIVSILIGRQFLSLQRQNIAKVTEQQQKHIERNVEAHPEMGLLLYYLRFALVNPPAPLSALSIGQRDVNPGVISVTIRTLEGQKYDTDLSNPMQLQMGNLDLSFVILYLFPLVIIVLTFNLLSEETESGTWSLVAVQSRSVWKFLLYKLLIRIVLVYAVLFVLLIFSFVMLSIPLDSRFFAFALLSCLYTAFWFTVCFFVVLWKNSSRFNVLSLLTVWVMLTLLIPSAVNNIVTVQHPVPEALGTMLRQRDGYHQKWDVERSVTMDRFYQHYPQFKEYGVPDEQFSWLWYYAMQQMGDDESAEESLALKAKILQRDKMSRQFAYMIPTMHAQLQFNDIAGTSLTNYVAFLDDAAIFHEKMRLHFYPEIFEDKSAAAQDWSSFKPQYFASSHKVDWRQLIAPLAIAILVMLAGIWERSLSLVRTIS